jgi:hypothetical protein
MQPMKKKKGEEERKMSQEEMLLEAAQTGWLCCSWFVVQPQVLRLRGCKSLWGQLSYIF